MPANPKYGRTHQLARQQLLMGVRFGVTPCCRCGHPLMAGDRIDLDHGEHGGYLGFSHNSPCGKCGQRCNQAAGGVKSGRLRRLVGARRAGRSKGRRW